MGAGWEETEKSPVILMSITLHYAVAEHWFLELGGGPLWFTKKAKSSVSPRVAIGYAQSL